MGDNPTVASSEGYKKSAQKNAKMSYESHENTYKCC